MRPYYEVMDLGKIREVKLMKVREEICDEMREAAAGLGDEEEM